MSNLRDLIIEHVPIPVNRRAVLSRLILKRINFTDAAFDRAIDNLVHEGMLIEVIFESDGYSHHYLCPKETEITIRKM